MSYPPLRLFSAFAARWRVALLVCVTTLIWVAHYDRWTRASWSLPTSYQGDALEILARIQASAEGDTVPLRPQVITRLGAPFGANWSAYPSSDLLLMWGLGRVARVIGVFPTANVAVLLATVSAALAFYGCARWLRARWEWAFAGALLFAFTYQSFHRGLPHLFVAFAWTVPLALLSVGMIAAARRLEWRSGMGVFCLATAAVVGIGNPYTLFLYLQLLGWALMAQWLGHRRAENLRVGFAAAAIAIAGFFLIESHVWLFAPDTAAASPIVRNYGGTERYALKPLELLLPPANHRWAPMAFLGQRYVRWSDWRIGEPFASYLGIVGVVALAWLAALSARQLLRRDRLPRPALTTLWVLAFASIGGITNMVAFFTGITVFRATNRYSIFISAIVLLFLVARLTRWSVRLPRWVSVAAAALIAVAGVCDEVPHGFDRDLQARIARRVESDAQLGAALERRLPDRSMVFQLPVLGFPEVVPPQQLTDYEYFRPYLGSHTLRYTYGSLKGRSDGRWQRDVAELPTPQLVDRLESYGFAAIYINRRGFADRGERLLRELAAVGCRQRVQGPSGEQVVVLLKPARDPALPLARSLTFGQGWHELRPGQPRWAYGPATLSYFNPYDRPLHCRIHLMIAAEGQRHVCVRVNDRTRIDTEIDDDRRPLIVPVTLEPGMNRIDMDSPEPAVRLSNGRDQLRMFALYEASVLPEVMMAGRPPLNGT